MSKFEEYKKMKLNSKSLREKAHGLAARKLNWNSRNLSLYTDSDGFRLCNYRTYNKTQIHITEDQLRSLKKHLDFLLG